MREKSNWRVTYILGVAAVAFLLGRPAHAVNPVPTVTGPVHPQAVVPGHTDFTLTVYGANFVNGAVVNWNGSPRSTTFVSARELQAKILSSDVAKPTAGYITVTNPQPGGGTSSSSYAIVEVHAPTKTIVPGQPNTYFMGYDPIESLSTGFFHRSDTLDLIGGAGNTNVYLFNSNGNGTFSYSVVGTGYYNDYNCNLQVGDFNNDGKLDYVFPVGRIQQPVSVEVRLGNGKGGFRTSWKHGNFQDCPYTAVGDFNRDGNLDFAAASIDGVYIFLGNGDGTFRQGEVLVFGQYPVIGDFNGDGKLDLVYESDAKIYLLLGNGDGTFQNPRWIASGSSEACGSGTPLVVDDFNGDGKLDLAFCSFDFNGQMVVLLGKGDGTFKQPRYYHAGTSYSQWAFAAGDFTSDGITDFIVWYLTAPHGHNYFAILKGNGDGTFQRETQVKLPDNIEDMGLVPGDFNSDGLLDFITLPAAGGIQSYTQK